MKLNNCLLSLKKKIIQNIGNIEISSIEYNSKRINKGSIFIAIKGHVTDGHLFIEDAINKGAKIILFENDKYINSFKKNKNVGFIQVENSRVALAIVSSNFFEHPEKKINIFGVTGTNGKTSITYLLKNIFNKLGIKVGIIGTIKNQIGKKIIKSNITTPESRDLEELFKKMLEEKCYNCIMEVSSHALYLNRVSNILFKVGIFTNLTQDHLDFHKSFKNYLESKKILFKLIKEDGFSVINIDDKNWKSIISETKNKVITYGIYKKNTNFYAKLIKMSLSGTRYTLIYKNKEYIVSLKLIGRFNVYNSLAAIATSVSYGMPIKKVIKAISNLKIKGRFQIIESKKNFSVIIDYAHTPDGLLNILKTAKELTKKNIICVFGCGGDRDKKKRSIMGRIAAEYSDLIIITSDNPRNEDSEKIINMIESGVIKVMRNYLKIKNRKEAIIKAISLAKKDDIIIIAGKGHEEYQVLGDKKYSFSDIKIVKKILNGVIKK